MFVHLWYAHVHTRCVQIRSQAEFEALYATKAPAGKRYFHHTRLPEIIGAYPIKANADEARERERRQAFLDFLLGVLVCCSHLTEP